MKRSNVADRDCGALLYYNVTRLLEAGTRYQEPACAIKN